MRTTLSIDDALLEAAKEAALQRKCSLGAVGEDALRMRLLSQKSRGDVIAERPWVTYGKQGLREGVSLNDSASLDHGFKRFETLKWLNPLSVT